MLQCLSCIVAAHYIVLLVQSSLSFHFSCLVEACCVHCFVDSGSLLYALIRCLVHCKNTCCRLTLYLKKSLPQLYFVAVVVGLVVGAGKNKLEHTANMITVK